MSSKQQIIEEYNKAFSALDNMCKDALARRDLSELKELAEMLPYSSQRQFVFSEIYTIEHGLPSYNNR